MRVRVQRTRARRGEEATLQTVALIRRAIVEGSQSWKVRQCALGIVRAAGVRPKDYAGELGALFAWCTRHLRYTRDPATAELVQTSEVLLGQIEAEGAGGDCDDQTVLLGALAASIGFPVAVRIIGDAPGQYRHVHLRVKVRDRWVPADLTAWPRRGLGWEAKAPAERVFLLSGKELGAMDEPTFSGTLEGLGEGPFELSLGDLAEHASALGYGTFTLHPAGNRTEVLGLSGPNDELGDVIGELEGPFDFITNAVSAGAGLIGRAASTAAPLVGMVNPGAGASLAAGGAIASGVSDVTRGGGGGGGGGRPAPRAAPPPRSAPSPRIAPAPAAVRPAPAPGRIAPAGGVRPQAIAITRGPGSGGTFFQRYKVPLLIGGVVVLGAGAYFVLRKQKQKGRRR